MRWAVILWLIVGVGAGASAQQVKDVLRAEAEAKAAFRARTGGAQRGEDG